MKLANFLCLYASGIMPKIPWNLLATLILILPKTSVVCIELILHPVGSGAQHPQLVVFDQEGSRTFCYPNLDEVEDQDQDHLPAIHRDHGLDPQSAVTQLHNNARVICREVSGYTHLKRVYPIAAPRKIPGSNKRVQWMAECVGYEPLLSHCFTFNVSDKDSRCENLLGIECGYCSGKVKLKTGESKILTNPEYPHYSDDVICEWQIQTPLASAIEVSFNDFELPPRNEKGHCHRGLLEIKGIHKDQKGELITKAITSLCGSDLPDPVSIPSNGAVIRFSSGLFIPRPVGEDAGFNLTVTAVAVPGQIIIYLNNGEIMAVVFGVLLLLFTILFVCYVVRRYKKDRQSSLQRRLMQERLATQRQGRHDAALSAMLAASLHGRSAGPSNPSPFAKYFCGGGIKKEKTSRTTSVQSRNTYATLGYPPPPPAPPPPPPPFTVAPPPPPPLPSAGHKDHGNTVSFSNKRGHETDEEPLYMEAAPLEKSFSYIQLDDIKCDNTSPGRGRQIKYPYHSFCSNILTPPMIGNQLGNSNFSSNYPNNLKPMTGSPYLGSPRNVSCSAQNMTSNTLNLWPSTSSLTPSNKTVPLTPSRKKSLNLNFTLGPWNNLSGGGSISSFSESITPFPGHTPKTPRRPSDRSQCSMRVQHSFNSCHNSNVTLTDICNTPCRPRCASHGRGRHSYPTGTLHPPTSPRHTRFIHPDSASISSSESVFTSGENLAHDHNNNFGSLCKYCFSHTSDHLELASSISHPPGHLSKSCGDVSPTTPLPQQDMIFDTNMIQSAPASPGAQSSLGFVKPVLRRVSQMFLGSPALYTPEPESKRSDDDTGKFFESSNPSSEEGDKILEKKQEGNVFVDAKGPGSIRKLGGKAISEAALRKDKMPPLASSPRRPAASSVSSTSFLHYKYNLLEKESNADRHALIPRSNSPETSEGSNSPNDRQAL